jgi:hypothetical protein
VAGLAVSAEIRRADRPEPTSFPELMGWTFTPSQGNRCPLSRISLDAAQDTRV